MFTSAPEYAHALLPTPHLKKNEKKKSLSSIRNTAVIVWCTLDIQEKNVDPLTRLFFPTTIESFVLSSGSLTADGPDVSLRFCTMISGLQVLGVTQACDLGSFCQ